MLVGLNYLIDLFCCFCRFRFALLGFVSFIAFALAFCVLMLIDEYLV